MHATATLRGPIARCVPRRPVAPTLRRSRPAGLRSRIHTTRRRRPDSGTRGERGVLSCEPPRLVRLPAGLRTPLRQAVFSARLTDETDDPSATRTEIVHSPERSNILSTFEYLPFPRDAPGATPLRVDSLARPTPRRRASRPSGRLRR